MEKKKKIFLLVGGVVLLGVMTLIMLVLGYFLFLKPKGCEYNGKNYNNKERFEAEDGCNTCVCEDGGVGCTEMACDFPEEEIDMEDPEYFEEEEQADFYNNEGEEQADHESLKDFQNFEYVWYENKYVKFRYPDNWNVNVESGVFEEDAGDGIKTFEGVKSIEMSYGDDYGLYLYPLTGHGISCLSYDATDQVVYSGGDTVGEEGMRAWYLSKTPSFTKMQINRGGEKLNFEWLNFSRDIISSQGFENTESREEYNYDGEFSYRANFAMESTEDTYCNSIVFKDFPGKPILGGEGEWAYGFLAEVEDPDLDLLYSNEFKSKEDFDTYVKILKTFLETAERKEF